MDIYARIKRDIAHQSGQAGEIILTRPDGSESITVNGYYTDHTNELDFSTGRAVNSRSAHFSVHSSFLTDAGFPVNLNKFHADFNGNHYKVTEPIPNRTTGMVICLVKDAKN